MKTKGFFWHIHHDNLLEWSDNIEERIAYIKKEKPVEEIEIRLRLIKPVKGKLPDEAVKAYKARDKANKARDKANKAWDKARNKANKAWDKSYEADKARDKAYKAWDKAGDKANKARDKANKARNKAKENHKSEIEALHKLECPDCPWNGLTIFPEHEAKP